MIYQEKLSIASLEDCNKVLMVKSQYDEPSSDNLQNVIEFLNEYIINNQNNAKAYYLRSMARFSLVNYDHKLFIKHTNDAIDDYEKAISIDLDIVNKNPDIRTIIHSNIGRCYFRIPINSKLLNVFFGNVMWHEITKCLMFIFIIMFIIYDTSMHFSGHFYVLRFYCVSLLSIIVMFSEHIIYDIYISRKAQNIAKQYCDWVDIPRDRDDY